jgi:DHA1 family bicyclomycin/chloramphenicol resistance-like MFS transporter
MKKILSSLPFLVMLSIATVVFSFDLYIPSLPAIADAFSTSQEWAQLTMSAGILGSSLLTLLLGPLSDALGRRLILLISMVIFTLSSFAAVFSTSIEMLIICRLFQGMGGAAPMVLGFAIIADVYDHKQAALYYAYITTTITVSLVFAPMVGGYFAANFAWPSNFIFLGITGFLSTLLLIWGLDETLKQKRPFSFDRFLSYKKMLLHKNFMQMAFLPSLMIGGFVAFISIAAFYFIKELGIPPGTYGLYQSGMMFFNAFFSYLSGRAIRAFSVHKIARLGMILVTVGGVSFFLMALTPYHTPLMIAAAFSFYGAGLGFAFASITAESMALFPQEAGASSSAIGAIRGLVVSSSVSLSGYLYTNSILPIGVFILTITLLCLLLYRGIQKHIAAPQALAESHLEAHF